MNGSNKKAAVVALVILALVVISRAPNIFGAGGDEIYKSKCAMCHGPDGSGNTTMGKSLKLRDLRSPEVQNQTDDQMVALISNGKNKMPAWKGKLKTDEITQVLTTIRAFAKK